MRFLRVDYCTHESIVVSTIGGDSAQRIINIAREYSTSIFNVSSLYEEMILGMLSSIVNSTE